LAKAIHPSFETLRALENAPAARGAAPIPRSSTIVGGSRLAWNRHRDVFAGAAVRRFFPRHCPSFDDSSFALERYAVVDCRRNQAQHLKRPFPKPGIEWEVLR
jgi:hypothetical protein